jgi:excisionase family DNA binding protein
MKQPDNANERLMRFLQATPAQQAAIDQIFDGKMPSNESGATGPLLMGMSQAAKFLGTSRSTLWRIIKQGRLAKIEILPGSYRVRRSDLEQLCK